MKNQIYLNKQVSQIVGVTPRQVLSWSEKALIVPFEESTGAGTKRGYDYVNLLEFGLCKTLFFVGIGFRGVKKIITDLREMGALRSWSENFNDYYNAITEQTKNSYMRWAAKNADILESKEILGQFEKALLTPYKPEYPIGVLVYFFRENEKPDIKIIPWEMDYVANLNLIKEGLNKSIGSVFVDIGKIKSAIDKKL